MQVQYHRPDTGDHGGAVRPAERPASRPASCACALVHFHPFHASALHGPVTAVLRRSDDGVGLYASPVEARTRRPLPSARCRGVGGGRTHGGGRLSTTFPSPRLRVRAPDRTVTEPPLAPPAATPLHAHPSPARRRRSGRVTA